MENEKYLSILGFIAGVLTAVSMLPQLIKTIKEKKVEDVSPLMLIVLISGIACWTLYGFFKNDLPLLITNSFSFLLNSIMLFLRFKYKRGS